MQGSEAVLGRRISVKVIDVDRWCHTYFGAGIESVLFCDGYLSTVLGVELTSGTRIVVKVRPWVERLRGCGFVHSHMFKRGFPCPEPLTELKPMNGLIASAEMMMSDGLVHPPSGRSPIPYAMALARLMEIAPLVVEVPSLSPPPSWTAPDLGSSELWRKPENQDLDLNRAKGPKWLDDAGRAAKMRMAESKSTLVIGRGDWYTGNLRWTGDELYAVWDWDSVVAASEPAVVGLAAAVYPADSAGTEATVEESEEFLSAYQEIRGPFSTEELAEAWAAGLWNRSFDAKVQAATEGEPKSLTEVEALERVHRSRRL
jgi:hypothetical protein